jgi:hypothetical protein
LDVTQLLDATGNVGHSLLFLFLTDIPGIAASIRHDLVCPLQECLRSGPSGGSERGHSVHL